MTLPVGWKEWPAPAGVLGSAEGIQAALAALRFEGVVKRDGEALSFVATRRAGMLAGFAGALAGIVAYVAADSLGASSLVAVASVTVAALVLPFLLVPAYAVAGRVEAGTVRLHVKARGLLGSAGSMEKRLRFYLERRA